MKPQITSYLRHVFTAWITTAIIGLTAWFALDEKSAAALAEGFGKIADGVLIVLAILVPALGRLVWAWAAKVIRPGAGELDDRTRNDSETGGGSGGALLLLVTGTVAGMGCLPPCASGQTQDFKTQDARDLLWGRHERP